MEPFDEEAHIASAVAIRMGSEPLARRLLEEMIETYDAFGLMTDDDKMNLLYLVMAILHGKGGYIELEKFDEFIDTVKKLPSGERFMQFIHIVVEL